MTGMAMTHVNFDNVDLGGSSNQFTVGMWINLQDRTRDQKLFSYGSVDSSSGFMCELRLAGGQNDIRCLHGDGSFSEYTSERIDELDDLGEDELIHLMVIKDEAGTWSDST